jgi:diacylglycerol kinase family enzyme
VLNPKVKILRGRKVNIETFAADDGLLIEADGNIRGHTPVEFEVLPAALRFVV